MRSVFSALQKIKIPGRISFQTSAVTVSAASGETIVVEILVIIGFAISVQIVQDGNLIAAQHMDPIAHDLQTKRLIQPRGKPLPGEFLKLIIDAADAPDIAMGRADGGVAIIKEVVATGEHKRL